MGAGQRLDVRSNNKGLRSLPFTDSLLSGMTQIEPCAMDTAFLLLESLEVARHKSRRFFSSSVFLLDRDTKLLYHIPLGRLHDDVEGA